MACRLVKLQRPPPEMRIFSPGASAWSTTRTLRPRLPAVAAHIMPAAPAPITMTSHLFIIAVHQADYAKDSERRRIGKVGGAGVRPLAIIVLYPSRPYEIWPIPVHKCAIKCAPIDGVFKLSIVSTTDRRGAIVARAFQYFRAMAIRWAREPMQACTPTWPTPMKFAVLEALAALALLSRAGSQGYDQSKLRAIARNGFEPMPQPVRHRLVASPAPTPPPRWRQAAQPDRDSPDGVPSPGHALRRYGRRRSYFIHNPGAVECDHRKSGK